MSIKPQSDRGVNLQKAHSQRTPISTYKPDNADVTACVTYHDPILGIVAVTHRSSLGVMRASTAIHFDAGVFDRLEAAGCQWLECFIKDSKTTYRTKIDRHVRGWRQDSGFQAGKKQRCHATAHVGSVHQTAITVQRL